MRHALAAFLILLAGALVIKYPAGSVLCLAAIAMLKPNKHDDANFTTWLLILGGIAGLLALIGLVPWHPTMDTPSGY